MTKTGSELLRHGVAELRAAHIPDPVQDARRLLAHVIGCETGRLSLVLSDTVSQDQAEKYYDALNARGERQPVSHIVGTRLFWNSEFKVTSDVLDPRPETEILVAEALKLDFSRLLDLGTGSGCILLSILAESPQGIGLGVDQSAAALAVAWDNADRLGLSERADFSTSDWFSNVSGPFDLIVSNPPYIRQDEMADLSPEVRLWEPRGALTPGPEGLESYRTIADKATEFLTPGGHVLLEIGPDQAASVLEIFACAGLPEGQVIRDLDGRDRVVVLKKQH